MNAGKSTALIQVAFNYEERGQRALVIKPTIDTKDTVVLSRLNIYREVDIQATPETNLLTELLDCLAQAEETSSPFHCILIDEAQFLTTAQVDQLFEFAVIYGIPVIAYGIRTDFQRNAFTGSARLLELAHSIEELKTICRCGKKAIFNGRKIDGEFVSAGSQVAIDGQDATYESLCGACYRKEVEQAG